ncbi:hypothetical protein CYMTET_6925 [Cymbomonas tetramitiformis]|uniref:Uncharacterized protein n=1 Tax=Cymbomonas tetramitiformis TaxID=36881 RepID=A0AAE0GWI1_9CHLO|nr:hypothetical protein CYMTET_6925 [Cymbomonas tetramitiformis]
MANTRKKARINTNTRAQTTPNLPDIPDGPSASDMSLDSPQHSDQEEDFLPFLTPEKSLADTPEKTPIPPAKKAKCTEPRSGETVRENPKKHGKQTGAACPL